MSKHQRKSGSQSRRRQGNVVELRPGQAKPNPAPAAFLPERVAALEQNQQNFVRVFNQNMGAHQRALYAADTLIHVLQRVTNNLFTGQKRLVKLQMEVTRVLASDATPPHLRVEQAHALITAALVDEEHPLLPVMLNEDALINFPAYIWEQAYCIRFLDFWTQLKKWMSAEETKPADQEAEAAALSEAIAGPSEDVEDVVTEYGGTG